MSNARITKVFVDRIQSTDKDQFIWDTEIKGFGLKVTPAGRKVYLMQYRFESKFCRFTIGVNGSPWTPEEAREQSRKVFKQLGNGENPTIIKKEKRADAFTVEKLADLFMQEYALPLTKAKTSYEYQGLLNRILLPTFGHRLCQSITRNDISQLRLKWQGTTYQSNRAIRLLSQRFKWAVRQEYWKGINPCDDMGKYKESPNTRRLSEEEYIKIGQALQQAADQKSVNPSAIAVIRLLCLMGARLSEILNLKWSYIDEEASRIYLPHSKTGKWEIQISTQVKKILADLPKLSDNPYVIVGEKQGQHLVNLQKSWRKICKMAGLDQDHNNVTIHDLRRSYTSIGINSGVDMHIAKELLGHSQIATTARHYAFLDDSVKKQANDLIGEKIANILNSKSR